LTQKPKTQLFNSPYLLLAILLIPLLGLFTYATVLEPALFIYLSTGFGIYILYLILLRSRLAEKKSEIELQIQNYTEQANLVESEIQHEKGRF